jgi:demethylmenaquinone methyltransferase/2-methoxy-6-polyprenyl-1,4-benzoquinol methylase
MKNADLDRIEEAYRRVGTRWAWNALSFAGFQGWESTVRRRTVEHLELRAGHSVLDVACGRGSNLPYLQRAVGDGGRIVGLDYSATMLAGARELARRRRWTNVELVQADAAEMAYQAEFDGAVCTLGMTVIPRWQEALRRMVAAVRPEGRVALFEGRLGNGLKRVWNPYYRLLTRFSASDLSRDVSSECRSLLSEFREDAVSISSTYILSGEVPRPGGAPRV